MVIILSSCFGTPPSSSFFDSDEDSSSPITADVSKLQFSNIFSGAVSTQDQPEIRGSDFSDFNGGSLKLFLDSSCKSQIGTAPISNSNVLVSNIDFDKNESSVGEKHFYAKFTKSSGESTDCIDTNLKYKFALESQMLLSAAVNSVIDSSGEIIYLIGQSNTEKGFLAKHNRTSGETSILSNFMTDSGINLEAPKGISLSDDDKILYLTDSNLGLLKIDLESQQSSVVSSSSVGGGAGLFTPTQLVINSAQTTAYMIGANGLAIYIVDLSTGVRSTIQTGSGPSFGDLTDLVLSADEATLYVIDRSALMVLEVDIATGIRSILSAPGTGTGTSFVTPHSINIDISNNRLFIGDTGFAGIFSVSLASGTKGNRSILASSSVGSGTNIQTPSSMNFDSSTNKLIFFDEGVDAVLLVDTSSGNRSLVYTNNIGTGPSLDRPYGLHINKTGTTIYVADTQLDAILAIDVATGNRSYASGGGVGSGTALQSIRDVVINNSGTKLYVSDQDARRVFEIDLATGNRSILYSLGSPFAPSGIAISADDSTLFVTDNSAFSRVFSVNTSTGSGTLIASNSTGSGDFLSRMAKVALSTDESKLYITSDNTTPATYEVELNSGSASSVRTKISGDSVGTGESTFNSYSIVINADSTIAYISNLDTSTGLNSSIQAIPLTGSNRLHRTIVSGTSKGIGPLVSIARDMVYSPDHKYLYLVEDGWNLIMKVNVETGDRYLISK